MGRRDCIAWVACAALLCTASCAFPIVESGPAPVGETRQRETTESRRRRARLEEERHARQDAEDAGLQDPGTARADPERIASTRTRRYHRTECPALQSAPDAERVRFGSPWDALNAGYAPCPECRPGP